MGNKRKRETARSKTFGIAGGIHRRKFKQRIARTLKNPTAVKAMKSSSMCVKKNLKLKMTRKCVDKAKKFICLRNEKENKITLQAMDQNKLIGNRILNLENLKKHVSEITCHAALCEKARIEASKGNDPIVLVSEKRNGFECVLTAKCKGCGEQFQVKNSNEIETNSGNVSEINVRAVWGSMVTGGGCSSLNECMGTLGVAAIHEKTYSKLETQIGEWWKEILEEDMKDAGREEKAIAEKDGKFFNGVPAISVVCDGGWCKRSHKHTFNAMAGVGVIFGLNTKKLLHIGVRNKLCYVCSAAQTKNVVPRAHKCYKNWSESSQAMESDIILEGFLECEQKHGVLYMQVIADGDSSVYSSIVQNVPVWGPHVQKMECANHCCKCLRTNLEKLVIDKPQYKGKGKLSVMNRKKIVQGVRCAIRMRSEESARVDAKRKLKLDIKNCARHVLGIHDQCSTDFCKHTPGKKSVASATADEDDGLGDDGDAIKEACEVWSDTVKELSEEEVSAIREGGKNSSVSSDLLRDVHFLLNRMADKADRLIGNFTSNLAESWMNIRCKFDGGKMTNRCFKGSFYARCYGGGLRTSQGPAWSPIVYARVTGRRADDVFINTYRQRTRKYVNTSRRQKKTTVKRNRFKRKIAIEKTNTGKKARHSYGQVLDDTQDLDKINLQKECDMYLQENVCVTPEEKKRIEIVTRGQSCNETWKEERRKRLTSSIFGEVMSRSENNNRPLLTKRLLYTNFQGNKFTRKGLLEEENTRKEYMNVKNKENVVVSHINVPGLVVSSQYAYLAASSDGVVHMMDGSEGLVEIKNLLQNREYMIRDAAMKEKSFCLAMTDGKLALKTKHKYHFQIQGQMNILNKSWCDFVVRRTNPHDMFIERIVCDQVLWQTKMVPKLQAFYTTHILPELAVPRNHSITGIRKPSVPWFTPSKTFRLNASKGQKHQSESTCTTTESSPKSSASSKSSGATGKAHPCTSVITKVSPDCHSTEPIHTLGLQSTEKRSRRSRKLRFVGRRIQHKWEDCDSCESWYCGIVLSVVSGKDGDSDAVYQVQYDKENEPYDVDNLTKDYMDGSLLFDDL